MSSNTALLSKLTCSKCHHHLSFYPIYLSRNQEKVCGRCHVPEEDWSHVRNEIYEEVAKNISFPCRYKTEGCMKTHCPDAMPDHENFCQYRTISCATTKFSECTWEGPLANLAEHCNEDHSFLIGQVPPMDFKESFERHHILKFNDDFFLIKLDYNVHTNILSATCTCLSIKPEIVSKSSCKLMLTNNSVSTSMSLVIGTVFEEQSSQIKLDHIRETSSGTSDVIGTIEIVESLEGKQANKELLIELKCPVCFDYMTGEIYQCTLGHSLCDRCKPNITSCPTCRSDLEESRNYTLEKIANLLVFPCKNSEDAGCNYISEPALVRDHEEFCLFGVHCCPLECAWKDSWKGLSAHIENSHSDSLLETNTKCVRIHSSYFKKVQVDRNVLIMSRNLFFLVKFYCDKQFFLWEIQLMGPKEEVENYNFEVQVRSDQSDALLGLMRTPCCSFQKGVEKPTRQFASLPVNSVKAFISDSFTYRIDLIN